MSERPSPEIPDPPGQCVPPSVASVPPAVATRARLGLQRPVVRGVLLAIVLLLCFAGLAVTSALAVRESFAPSDENMIVKIGCGGEEVGSRFNCDQVLQTKYSRWRLPIGPPTSGQSAWPWSWVAVPVAWVGQAYFLAWLCWYLFVGVPSPRRRWFHLLPLTGISFGVAGSLYFLYLLLFELPVICPLCVATHAINILLLVGTVLLWPREVLARREAVPTPGWRQALATAALMFAATWMVLNVHQLVGAWLGQAEYVRELNEIRKDPEFQVYQFEKAKKELAKQKVYSIPIDPTDPIYGQRDAARTLVIFADFQCGACRIVHDRILQLWPQIEQFAAPSGGIRLIYKHYPLYSACNYRAGTNAHAFSCEAARAAEAARIVGGDEAFWKMGASLYEHQDQLYRAPYVKLARDLGLDVARFVEAMKSDEAKRRVERHVHEGADAGMTGTPGVFLDGVSIKEFSTSGPSVWQYLLRQHPWPPAAPTTRPAGH